MALHLKLHRGGHVLTNISYRAILVPVAPQKQQSAVRAAGWVPGGGRNRAGILGGCMRHGRGTSWSITQNMSVIVLICEIMSTKSSAVSRSRYFCRPKFDLNIVEGHIRVRKLQLMMVFLKYFKSLHSSNWLFELWDRPIWIGWNRWERGEGGGNYLQSHIWVPDCVQFYIFRRQNFVRERYSLFTDGGSRR